MKSQNPGSNSLPIDLQFEIAAEIGLLLCSLRGGFTLEAISSFRALGVLMQSHPELSGAVTICLLTRDDAVDFLQHLTTKKGESRCE